MYAASRVFCTASSSYGLYEPPSITSQVAIIAQATPSAASGAISATSILQLVAARFKADSALATASADAAAAVSAHRRYRSRRRATAAATTTSTMQRQKTSLKSGDPDLRRSRKLKGLLLTYDSCARRRRRSAGR